MVRSIRPCAALLPALIPLLVGGLLVGGLFGAGGWLPAAWGGVLNLDDWKTDGSGWAEVRVGTKVHYRTTRERRVPGMQRPVRTVIETERTLTRIEDTQFVFRTRVKAGRAWQTAIEAIEARPAKDALVVKSEVLTTAAKLVIAGDAYTCRQIRYTRFRNGVRDDQIVAWVHETHGVLKTERGSGPSSVVTHTVTQFAVERKIGDVTLRCREFLIEELGTKGSVLVSSDVPGRIVEMRITVNRQGARSTLTRELVGISMPSSASSIKK